MVMPWSSRKRTSAAKPSTSHWSSSEWYSSILVRDRGDAERNGGLLLPDVVLVKSKIRLKSDKYWLQINFVL